MYVKRSNGKVNIKYNVFNLNIIRTAYTKLSVGQHGPSTKARVESGAIEE
jgi:hypothetical protein